MHTDTKNNSTEFKNIIKVLPDLLIFTYKKNLFIN